MDTLAMNAKSEAQVSITTGSTGEEIMMQQPVEQGHPMRNSVGPTPGAFHVGGGSGSEGSEDLDSEQPQNGDVEQGIVPSPLGTPTLEAHIVDEASEQARYNRLHEDLEKMREELSEERQQHKPPIMVPAVPVSFIEDCKSKLRWCFTFEFLTVILGCIGIALVISAITTAADPPLPPAFYDLVPLLESVLPERAATLSDPSSPQFQAAKWLAGNANFTAMSNQKRIQRYVLATLYFSTGGDKWFNKFGWLTDTDECDWWNSKWTEKENRTFCDGDGESLEMLFLNENNLRGQLPLELSLLSNSLVWVDFRNQQLQGPSFPTDLFLLTKLTRLELTLNPGIVGTLPSELVKLIALEYIGIGRMGIYGRLPTELGLLTGLETLGIEGNRHTGAIPTELGLATAIEELNMESNEFTGTIPKQLLLPYLEKLSCHNNSFTGTLPTELGLATALEYLALQNNYLKGTIPTELGLAPALKHFYLDGNTDLTGTIPTQIMLPNLEYLSLLNNSLTGTIPTEFGLAKSLKRAFLDNNYFTVTVPMQLLLLPLLENVTLHNNSLTGAIDFDGSCPSFELSADCGEVQCDCCTLCCFNNSVECEIGPSSL